MRRVLVGHDEQGRSTVALDKDVQAQSLPGVGDLYTFWSADGPATYPDDGLAPKSHGKMPGIGEIRFSVCNFPAGTLIDAGANDRTGIEWDAENAGMHQTDTTDMDLVLSGEMTLELDTGSVRLQRGDAVIIGGARHRWRNEGTEPASMLFVITGARRRPE